MKKGHLILLAVLGLAAVAVPAEAAKKNKTPSTDPSVETVDDTSGTPAPADPVKVAAADAANLKAAKGIVDSLKLNDPDKEARVAQVIATDLNAVRDWHNSHPAPADLTLKMADDPTVPEVEEAGAAQAAEDEKIDPSVLATFNKGLAADLTPDQIETVKDKLTIGKVQFTYNGFIQMLKNPTDVEKAEILKDLKQAREDSLNVKDTKKGKSAGFKLYKKKIQGYLNAHGHNFDKEYKAWVEGMKAKKAAGSTTEPAADTAG